MIYNVTMGVVQNWTDKIKCMIYYYNFAAVLALMQPRQNLHYLYVWSIIQSAL